MSHNDPQEINQGIFREYPMPTYLKPYLYFIKHYCISKVKRVQVHFKQVPLPKQTMKLENTISYGHLEKIYLPVKSSDIDGFSHLKAL